MGFLRLRQRNSAFCLPTKNHGYGSINISIIIIRTYNNIITSSPYITYIICPVRPHTTSVRMFANESLYLRTYIVVIVIIIHDYFMMPPSKARKQAAVFLSVCNANLGGRMRF
jgi:hypothetical protein